MVLDPFNLDHNVALGFVLRNAGKYDQAIVQLQKTLDLDRNWSTARLWLAESYASKGSHNEAVAEYQDWLHQVLVSAGAVPAIAGLAAAYARSTWRGFWQKELELAEEEMRRPATVWSVPYNRHCGPYYMARRYARLGDHDRTIASLESAYAQRHHQMVMLKVEPLFDGLRTDPRFQDFLRRVRIP